MRRRIRWDRVAINAVLIFIVLLFLIPLFSVVNVALKSEEEFLKYPASLVKSITLGNFAMAWKEAYMAVYFKNSVLITFFATLGITLLAAVASFPISRRHFKGATLLYFFLLSSTFLPTSLVPMIFLMKTLHFINSYHGIIIRGIGVGVALPVFIFVGFIKGIPRELDEAGAIDGCGYLKYIFHVIMPLMKPAISTVAILSAIGTWNDFINPYLFLTDKMKRPLTSGLYLFVGEFSTRYTVLCAGVIVVVLPLLLLYILMQRNIIAGMVSGSVKG